MLALDSETSSLKRTPLHALHLARGARMVPFAGYEMPVQYSTGVMKEHLHTRNLAGDLPVHRIRHARALRRPASATVRGRAGASRDDAELRDHRADRNRDDAQPR